MKPIQYFSDDYLKQCRQFSSMETLEFLDNFRQLQEVSHSKLISIKIPEPLLNVFKSKCKTLGIAYQTQIKELMRRYLEE